MSSSSNEKQTKSSLEMKLERKRTRRMSLWVQINIAHGPMEKVMHNSKEIKNGQRRSEQKAIESSDTIMRPLCLQTNRKCLPKIWFYWKCEKIRWTETSVTVVLVNNQWKSNSQAHMTISIAMNTLATWGHCNCRDWKQITKSVISKAFNLNFEHRNLSLQEYPVAAVMKPIHFDKQATCLHFIYVRSLSFSLLDASQKKNS